MISVFLHLRAFTVHPQLIHLKQFLLFTCNLRHTTVTYMFILWFIAWDPLGHSLGKTWLFWCQWSLLTPSGAVPLASVEPNVILLFFFHEIKLVLHYNFKIMENRHCQNWFIINMILTSSQEQGISLIKQKYLGLKLCIFIHVLPSL